MPTANNTTSSGIEPEAQNQAGCERGSLAAKTSLFQSQAKCYKKLKCLTSRTESRDWHGCVGLG